jgi:hypothetical protein
VQLDARPVAERAFASFARPAAEVSDEIAEEWGYAIGERGDRDRADPA